MYLLRLLLISFFSHSDGTIQQVWRPRDVISGVKKCLLLLFNPSNTNRLFSKPPNIQKIPLYPQKLNLIYTYMYIHISLVTITWTYSTCTPRLAYMYTVIQVPQVPELVCMAYEECISKLIEYSMLFFCLESYVVLCRSRT